MTIMFFVRQLVVVDDYLLHGINTLFNTQGRVIPV